MSSLRILFVLAILPTAVAAQWSAPLKLSTADTSTRLNENMGRCLAVSGDSVHVVWVDGTSGVLYYKHSFDAGMTWSTDAALTAGLSDFSCIAVNGSTVHIAYRG